MPREKFSIDGQIQQMKSKGIKFEMIDEKEAKEFLANHTYYFRLKFYANNYTVPAGYLSTASHVLHCYGCGALCQNQFAGFLREK